MYELKTYRGVTCNDTMFDSRAWKVSNIYTLMGCFWPKHIMFQLKNYRGVIFHGTWVWCKTWKKTNLWFGCWQEEFGKFSSVYTEVLKLGLTLCRFIQNIQYMSLKPIRELCVMTMKHDANFERELICQFKINMRNLTNFDPSTRRSQKFAF